MPYKRRLAAKKSEQHDLVKLFGHLGQLTLHLDAGWHENYENFLDDLHSAGVIALSQIKDTLKRANELDVSDYKPEVGKRKRGELVKSAQHALLSFLKQSIQAAGTNLTQVREKILRVTQVAQTDPSKPMTKQDFRLAQIANYLQTVDPKDRPAVIKGNLDFIKACIDSPIPLLSPDHLIEMRREYAFTVEPELALEERDAAEMYDLVRRRAGEINATAIKMIVDNKLDDQVTPPEFFDTFPPRNDFEKAQSQKRIQAWTREQDKQAKRAEFEAADKGLNLEIQDRRERHRV